MNTKYVSPVITVIAARTKNLLCLSVQSGNANTSSEQDGGGYMLSPHFDFCDDED